MNPLSPAGCAPTSSGDTRKFEQGARQEFHEKPGATLRLNPHASKSAGCGTRKFKGVGSGGLKGLATRPRSRKLVTIVLDPGESLCFLFS
jgi:hypothetical protein